MTEEYKPREDLTDALIESTKDHLSRDTLKSRASESFLDYVVPAVKGSVVTFILPYMIPTAVRLSKEESQPVHQGLTYERKEMMEDGADTGFMIGGLGFIAHTTMYFANPGLFVIPVVTTAISGVYEIGRSIYQGAQRRIEERRESIEAKLLEE